MRIGIDLGGTKIEGILIDADGVEIRRRRIAAPRGDYAATVEAVASLAEWLQDSPADSIGIGIPGTLSPATGLIKNANSTWLIGEAFDADLARRLGRPVRLANDADCFTLSEARDGAGAGAASVFGVILGTGVGGGLVFDGRLQAGPNAIAGEWGHNPLPWPDPAAGELPGPDCYCGLAGCIETFLSGPGLAADHRRTGGEDLDAAAIARADTPATRASLERYIDRLSRALAGVINLIDPEVIVLGGGLSNIAPLYDGVPERWQRYVFSDRVDTRLVANRHGDSSGVRGAAWLWPAD